MVLAVLTCCCFALLACGGDDNGPVPPANNNNPNDGNKNSTQLTFQLMQDCPTCNGSTQCIDCNGTGKGCKTCQGTGKYCKNCGTTGVCDDCGGTGNCHSCIDKGYKTCSYCWGEGVKYGKKCQTCGGTGSVECEYCLGKGKCPSCNGYLTCQTCHGNPECKTCGGDGHCSTCINSDGKCKDCTGTGKVSAQSLSFTDGSDNKRIFVHSTGDWQVSSDVEWLTFSRSSGSGDYTLTVTAAKNNSVSTRNGIITFTYGDSKTNVSVSQSGESANLSVDVSSVFVSSSGSGATINITSNTSWTIKAADSWVTCTPSNGTGNASVSVSASAYNGTRYSNQCDIRQPGEVQRCTVTGTAALVVRQSHDREVGKFSIAADCMVGGKDIGAALSDAGVAAGPVLIGQQRRKRTGNFINAALVVAQVDDQILHALRFQVAQFLSEHFTCPLVGCQSCIRKCPGRRCRCLPI